MLSVISIIMGYTLLILALGSLGVAAVVLHVLVMCVCLPLTRRMQQAVKSRNPSGSGRP